ncbi:hypothetical protein LSTR_LSTR014631 [Laodelphax striatellus]|uniref:Uncharacterized protein n=1 Tax=Laodelphax striatellus TaxID=195883 RepID=A0A482XQD3_LAOST|nr:hypothetical protein LSTR_LSTR014631 [Laodelphax striatellus]
MSSWNTPRVPFWRRGKKKKEHALYVVAMATALAVLIPLTLKGIALIAAKALLIAKVALVLAGLAALKHFTHHEESHRRVHIADDVHDAHSLAYGAYAPSHAV